jgi:RNA polymerase sigma factor FliA
MSSNLLRKYKEEPHKLTPQQKDKLIMEYAPLIKFIAQKISVRLPSNIELDDLISSGVIGLMDAIEKYDPSRDNKFKTYAEFRIRGAILDELRAQDWVPRSVRDKAKLLDRTYSGLEQSMGRSPTDEEVAAELKMSMDEFYDLVNQVRPVSLLSIDDTQTFSNVDKKSILNLLESCRLNNPYNQLSLKTVKDIVTKAIEELPEKQRLVLSLYYYEDLNLKEIGKVLDVTESRVSQLHAQAVTRLRAKLASHLGEEGFA